MTEEHHDRVTRDSFDSSRGEGRTIASKDLLQGGSEVLIDHEGEVYRLRRTRHGKLILHK